MRGTLIDRLIGCHGEGDQRRSRLAMNKEGKRAKDEARQAVNKCERFFF